MKWYISFFISVMFSISLWADCTYEVSRAGKVIHIDGFLIEWSSETSDTCPWDVPIVWDAMETSLGVAGYFRCTLLGSCRLENMHYYAGEPLALKNSFSFDSSLQPTANFALEKYTEEADSAFIIEWQIPWEELAVNEKGNYTCTFQFTNSCSDSLTHIILSGTKEVVIQQDQIITPKIRLQVIMIVILLVLFILVKGRARQLKGK